MTRAAACGLATHDFQAAMAAETTSTQLEMILANALHAGVFGVPTFVASEQLFWGDDRITLLMHHLRLNRDAHA